MPKLSVVIPHYQDLGGLELCLASLERQTYSRSQFEIIVADNASPIGKAAVAAVTRDRAKLIVCPEKGAGPARNAGVAASSGEILAFIDSDCQAEPEWLANGTAGLSQFDFIGGRVKVLVDDPDRMTAAEAFEAVFAFDFKTYITKKGFTGAGNMMCARTLFDRVGGFRVGLSEDLEWSHRARANGFRLGYVDDAVVGHPARRTWPELREKWRRVNAETYGLSRGRPMAGLRWFARSFALPLSAIAHTPKVLKARQLSSGRDRMLALAMLYRLRLWRFAHALTLLRPRST
jgi:glycosyltransferase involved in cell wall biosynthesis